eukprot:Nk52_evm52s221 gene=Nk52_evmTU52s221
MSVIEKINAQRRKDILAAREAVPSENLELMIKENGYTPVDFYSKIRNAQPMAILAEVKRASPAKGMINADLDAGMRALEYAKGGAATVSVLTEPTWFKGTLKDLADARKQLDSLGTDRPALLRKDFILDEYQILEARAYGADTCLLIVKSLDDDELGRLVDFARKHSLEPLVEVNNAEETRRALAVGAKVIGVNNRNLDTLEMDLNVTSEMKKIIPDSVAVLALSGVSTRQEIAKYEQEGVSGVLIGEAMSRTRNPGLFISYILGKGDRREALVKICGVRRPEDALCACRNGADFIGMIFVKGSKRYVEPEQAKTIVEAVRKETKEGYKKGIFKKPIDASEGSWFQECSSGLEKELHYARPMTVGVFIDETAENINEIVKYCGLDAVQFHGSETFALADDICVPVIKAVHIEEPADSKSVLESIKPKHVSVVLLDTKLPGQQGGGSGLTFDWVLGAEVSKHLPILVAGGLTPSSVADAVTQVKPWGVDVSSGVEDESGFKSAQKIKEFIHNAKSS